MNKWIGPWLKGAAIVAGAFSLMLLGNKFIGSDFLGGYGGLTYMFPIFGIMLYVIIKMAKK